VAPIRISLIDVCCLQGSYWTKGSCWLSWCHYFESFTFATMTWWTAMEYCKRTFIPIWQNQAVFLICIRRYFIFKWRRCVGQFQWQFLKKNCYFRNNRVPGQFAMCENLPWHRFQFNSQISIYFDIKQWFPSDISKMNIILSISM